MKKLLLSLSVLAVLAAACFLNARVVGGAAEAMETELGQLAAAVRQGDWDSAEASLARTEERWAAFAPYRESLLRHDEADSLTASLASLREAVETQDPAALPRAELACHSLRSLADMERPSLGSVF